MRRVDQTLSSHAPPQLATEVHMTDTNQPTEPNEVEFREKVQTPIGRTRAARAGIVAGAELTLAATSP